MKPIKFKQATKNLIKPSTMTDEECGSLWVYNDGMQSISCWKMTWKDRLKALFFGRIWLHVVSGDSQPPVLIQSEKTVF